jgi:ubiquinone/menaquinone biosynthesis C-methylase UbiE
MTKTAEQMSAEMYDIAVPDWEGEIDFYLDYAQKAKERGQSVLEIACGTGRITLRLARAGINIVGLDLDEEMLKIADQKSEGVPNVGWVRGDMRSFDIGQKFGLIISPGHSYQFMCTPEDQVQALEEFKRHLTPDGTLILHVDHQDMQWLASRSGKFEPAKTYRHPQTGRVIHREHAWTYERATQTATVISTWEELDENNSVLERWERKPMPLHCIFRFEMEHLLARTGFTRRTVYGDFRKSPLNENSTDMIWVAKQA